MYLFNREQWVLGKDPVPCLPQALLHALQAIVQTAFNGVLNSPGVNKQTKVDVIKRDLLI